MDEVKKEGDGVSDQECAKPALCSGYSPGKECKEIKIGGITSSLPFLITSSNIRGPGGNVSDCATMLRYARISCLVPLCPPGNNHKWAFTHAFLYGR